MTPEQSVEAVRERKRLERQKDLLILFYPLLFLYDELFLRIFAGDPVFKRFGYCLAFAIAAGLFCYGLQRVFGNKGKIVSFVILTAVTAVFVIESVIHSVFTTYISPVDIFSTAGNVARNYTGELTRSILLGIPKFLVFIAPVVLTWKLRAHWQTLCRLSLESAAALAAVGLILIGAISLIAGHTSSAAVYGAQFDYDRATDRFGLLTSTRLSFQYSLFGNRNIGFSETANSSENGTGTSAGEYLSGTAPEAEAADAAPTTDAVSAADAAATADTAAGAASETGPAGTAEPVPHVMSVDFGPVSNTSNETLDNLTAYITAQTPAMTNAYTGLFKGKNLILICAESYCSDFISENLTPTLWRLTHNGFYCTEYYQPEWGGSTTTGEASFLLGLAPKGGDQTMLEARDNNNYFTLGNQLQRLGYSSCAFHSGAITYYHRNETHENLGYNQFIANENGLTELCGAAYAKDTTVFDRTVGLYIDKQPFSIYYMTISGHAPYTKDSYYVETYYDRVNEAVGSAYKEKTKYYICYQMELENALTHLVARLEEAGIADDTVIALVGDHYPYGLGSGEAWRNDQDYIDDLIRGDSKVSFLQDRSNVIIWSGCLENEYKDMAVTYDEPVTSLDIVPTLSNLFGLEYDSRLLPGRDIFAGTEPLVYWNDLSWVTTEGSYDGKKELFYPAELNGEPSDDPKYADYRARIDTLIRDKILMSREIVETDYYGLLFGPDEVTQAGEILFPGGQ